jgi:CheY-like chemotaxis protein
MPAKDSRLILVVDDERDIQEMVSMALESEGYAVESASNGLEGMEHVSRRMPDLILLDMKMPTMDGWAFARDFHSQYDHQIPIIVITAAADARSRADETGAAGWLGKPFDLDDLLGAVAKHVRDE